MIINSHHLLKRMTSPKDHHVKVLFKYVAGGINCLNRKEVNKFLYIKFHDRELLKSVDNELIKHLNKCGWNCKISYKKELDKNGFSLCTYNLIKTA